MHPLRNVHENPRQGYAIDPLDFLRVMRQGEVVGIYHSHPDGPARPSAVDTATALPGFWYVIVSREDVQAFTRIEGEWRVHPIWEVVA